MTATVFTDKFPYEYTNHLDILSETERKVVVHYFGMGTPRLKLEEIAELLRKPGVSTTQVRGMLSQSMGKLREAYEKSQRTTGASSSNR